MSKRSRHKIVWIILTIIVSATLVLLTVAPALTG